MTLPSASHVGQNAASARWPLTPLRVDCVTSGKTSRHILRALAPISSARTSCTSRSSQTHVLAVYAACLHARRVRSREYSTNRLSLIRTSARNAGCASRNVPTQHSWRFRYQLGSKATPSLPYPKRLIPKMIPRNSIRMPAFIATVASMPAGSMALAFCTLTDAGAIARSSRQCSIAKVPAPIAMLAGRYALQVPSKAFSESAVHDINPPLLSSQVLAPLSS